ncbi:MAG: cyclic nucleotide-binding domain-containing protein, partial [Pseudomonadota bacterium]
MSQAQTLSGPSQAADIAAELKRHEGFDDLSDQTLASIALVARTIELDAGETIVREGETSRDLFVLVSGSAMAVRDDGDSNSDSTQIELNTVDTSDCIGELTFLAGGTRAASVKARTRCRLILIPADALDGLADHLEVVGALKGVLAGVVVRRNRRLSDEMLATLKEQLAIKTLQNQFGYFLILTISLFIVTSALLYMVSEEYVEDIYDPSFSWQTVVLLAIPSIIVIRLMKIPPRDLGIHGDRFWRSLGEAALLCVAFTIPVAIYLSVVGHQNAGNDSGASINTSFLLQYFVHCVLQEIGARGLLQNLFRKFLADKKGHKSVAFASIVFASLHITFGFDAVLVTLIASFGF